jgi:hypothetical protein
MMDARSCSETSALTGATWRHIPEDAILHTRRRENLEFYNRIRCLFALRFRFSVLNIEAARSSETFVNFQSLHGKR